MTDTSSQDPPEEPSKPGGKADPSPGAAAAGAGTAERPKPTTTSAAGSSSSGDPWSSPGSTAVRPYLRHDLPPPPPPIVYTPSKLDRAIHAWKPPSDAMSPALVAAVAVAGLVGAVTIGPTLRTGYPGVGVVVAAVAVACVTGVSAWSAGRVVRRRKGRLRFNWTGALFMLLTLCLTATVALRDAEWIVILALLLAFAVGSYAACGGRSWAEVLGGGLAFLPACGYTLPWTVRGGRQTISSRQNNVWPVIRTGLIVAVLLAVFGGLFVSADAVFGDLASDLVPEISVDAVFLYVFAGVMTLLLAATAAFLAQAPPPLRMLSPAAGKPAGRWSWAVPIAALDLLFLLFCAIQARVFLADDKDALLRSAGVTYAEYARQGFFQLVVVTLLVIAVVAVAVRYAPSGGRGDRIIVRGLLGLLCAFTLVVVGVALRRLYLYEEAFGWTRLRLWVHAFELWLGVVVALVAVAGVVKGRVAWLPRAVVASGAVAVIALVALNPDRFIAEKNIARFESTGKIDVSYLTNLSADAAPALDRLPEPQRSCALRRIKEALDDRSAMTANHARARAREILERRPVNQPLNCADSSRY